MSYHCENNLCGKKFFSASHLIRGRIVYCPECTARREESDRQCALDDYARSQDAYLGEGHFSTLADVKTEWEGQSIVSDPYYPFVPDHYVAHYKMIWALEEAKRTLSQKFDRIRFRGMCFPAWPKLQQPLFEVMQ